MSLTRPTIIQKPWAESGDKKTIPVASQIGITDGAASFVTGFPPDTMIDTGDGGIAPDGLDMNGILNIITQHIRFINAGGNPRFDATLCAEIGGYPVGVVLQDNSGVNLYRNVAANNTTDFNTTPASIGVSWIWLAGLTRNIVAGGGLTGGGSPATSDVTLNIGVPGTCGPSTTNAVTEDSHTHALTFPDAVTLTAGLGLTGGGSLSGNVTLNLGTPSTCSGSTTNTATEDNHTHSLSAATTDVAGVTRYATDAEALGRVVNVAAITPARLAYVLDALFGKRVFADNDFIRIPDVSGGYILQVFNVAVPSTGSGKTATFPVSFPNACRGVFPSVFATAIGSSDATVRIQNFTLSGLTFSVFDGGNDYAGGSIYFFAVGN